MKAAVAALSGCIVGAVLGWAVTKHFCIRLKTDTSLKRKVQRHGGVIRLRSTRIDKYKELHSNVWIEVLDRLKASNIQNYTVYYAPRLALLFSYFEYVGDDYDADMAAIASDPITKKWWAECEPCQQPLQWTGPPPSQNGVGKEPGDSWWTQLEEYFHYDPYPITE